MKINIFSKQILNYLYILLVFTLFLLGVFFVHTRYGHLLWIQVTEIILTLLLETHFKSKKLDKIKTNAHDLDDVLTFRVNSALKKEFSRICKENQSSASSELKRYMLKIVEQGSL